KNWTGCSPGQMICRMNSGRKIKDKLSHLINRWLFLKKQGTDDYLLTNKVLGVKLWGAVNAIALVLAVMSVNSTCVWVHHQPKIPDELKRKKDTI
ncbi:MAG: cyclic lactone autoinducer peptide, partial [Lachnobacterium sp.]|nr:cyclic lactone autoinducer peptide [Lachnobacterium sp.]